MAPQVYPVPKDRCGLSFRISQPVLDLLQVIRSETKERPGEVFQRLMYVEQGRREPRARILPTPLVMPPDARLLRHKDHRPLCFSVSQHMYDLLHNILSETDERPGELFQHLMYQELGRREKPEQTRKRVETALEASYGAIVWCPETRPAWAMRTQARRRTISGDLPVYGTYTT